MVAGIFVLFPALPQQLEQCLIHSKCSVNELILTKLFYYSHLELGEAAKKIGLITYSKTKVLKNFM